MHPSVKTTLSSPMTCPAASLSGAEDVTWRKGDGHGHLPSAPLLGDLRVRPLRLLVCKQQSHWGAWSQGVGLWKPVLRGALDPWLHLPGLADLNQPCGAGQGAETLSTGPHCTPRVPSTLLRAGVGVHVLHSRSRSALSFSPRGTREQTVTPRTPGDPKETREQTAAPPGPRVDERADGRPQDPQGPPGDKRADGCRPGTLGDQREDGRPPDPGPGQLPVASHRALRWCLQAFKFQH